MVFEGTYRNYNYTYFTDGKLEEYHPFGRSRRSDCPPSPYVHRQGDNGRAIRDISHSPSCGTSEQAGNTPPRVARHHGRTHPLPRGR